MTRNELARIAPRSMALVAASWALLTLGCEPLEPEFVPPVWVPDIDGAVPDDGNFGQPDRPPVPDLPPPIASPYAPTPTPAPPTVLPGVPRLVAIGDVHGDLTAATAALRTAGVVDDVGRWIGGDTVVVQLGDQLDRGDGERAILDWFERLRAEAEAAGGAFHPLIGNHEAMNVDQDFRYVTAGGFIEFDDVEGPLPEGMGVIAPHMRGRVSAFAPGGPYARVLSGHNTMMVVGDTAFVHGGITLDHVEYGLERMNAEVQAWMAGVGRRPFAAIGGTGPIWLRTYSSVTGAYECGLLEETLAAIPARRMVVAHTVQNTINPACDEAVWRVDVGMAAHYGGPTEVLEITDDGVRVIR